MGGKRERQGVSLPPRQAAEPALRRRQHSGGAYNSLPARRHSRLRARPVDPDAMVRAVGQAGRLGQQTGTFSTLPA